MMRAPSSTSARTISGIPAVVADDESGAANRRIEGTQPVADAIEVARTEWVPFGQLNFVIPAADLAFLVEEEGAVEGFIADTLGESEREAGVQGAGQLLETTDIGAVDWFGHFQHGFGCGPALDDFHHNIAFERTLGRQDQARFLLRGTDEQLFHSVSVAGFVPLGRSK